MESPVKHTPADPIYVAPDADRVPGVGPVRSKIEADLRNSLFACLVRHRLPVIAAELAAVAAAVAAGLPPAREGTAA